MLGIQGNCHWSEHFVTLVYLFTLVANQGTNACIGTIEATGVLTVGRALGISVQTCHFIAAFSCEKKLRKCIISWL